MMGDINCQPADMVRIFGDLEEMLILSVYSSMIRLMVKIKLTTAAQMGAKNYAEPFG